MSAAPGNADATERVYPLGHLLGLRTAVPALEIRLGSRALDVEAAEFSVWALAHGDPTGQADVWGPTGVLAAAEQAGLDDAEGHLGRLEDRGLLARATPGEASARELADRVRLVPLALGLGNTAERPQVYSVGRLGQPQALMTSSVYDLFQWAHLDTSLWRACEGAAVTAQRAGATDPGLTEPDELLTGLLESLHGLLMPSTVLLDTWGVA